jgi:hypothetical protein
VSTSVTRQAFEKWWITLALIHPTCLDVTAIDIKNGKANVCSVLRQSIKVRILLPLLVKLSPKSGRNLTILPGYLNIASSQPKNTRISRKLTPKIGCFLIVL